MTPATVALTNPVTNNLSVKPDIDGSFVARLLYVCFRWFSFYHLKTATTKKIPDKQANGEKERDKLFTNCIIISLKINDNISLGRNGPSA